jgi:hypothetical protein
MFTSTVRISIAAPRPQTAANRHQGLLDADIEARPPSHPFPEPARKSGAARNAGIMS